MSPQTARKLWREIEAIIGATIPHSERREWLADYPNDLDLLRHLMTGFLDKFPNLYGNTHAIWKCTDWIFRGERKPTLSDDDPRGALGCVYVVQMGAGGPIKIGFSLTPHKRLAAICASLPERIQVLKLWKGRFTDEKWLHSILAAHRLNGEWFSPHPDVLDRIEQLAYPLYPPIPPLYSPISSYLQVYV